MRKKVIIILFSLGMAIIVISAIAIVVASILVVPLDQHCALPACAPTGEQSALLAVVMIGLIFIIVGLIICFICWVGTLAKQGRQKQWAWFVGTLVAGILIPPIGSVCQLVYLIVVPEIPLLMTPVYIPGYQPYPPEISYQPAQQYQPMPPYPSQE